jgi:hypothetical protein
MKNYIESSALIHLSVFERKQLIGSTVLAQHHGGHVERFSNPTLQPAVSTQGSKHIHSTRRDFSFEIERINTFTSCARDDMYFMWWKAL